MAGRYHDELSPTEGALLGLLGHAGATDMSGYDLLQAFRGTLGAMWAPTKGHMYSALPRLVEQGWATSREVVQTNRPTKQVYRITRQGRAALRRWLAAPVEPGQGRDMLLVKLFFGDLGDPDDMLAHIRRRRTEAQEQRRELRALRREEGDALFPALTRRYALGFAQFTLRWTAEAEAAVARAGAQSSRRRHRG